MNAVPVQSQPTAEPAPAGGNWSRRRWILFLAVAFAAHLGFVWLFGAKRNPPPRRVTGAPQLKLAAGRDEIMALTDPTLLAVPHEAVDFFPDHWRHPTAVEPPPFRWTEPASKLFLRPAAEGWGASFSLFLRTNPFAGIPLDFKPSPPASVPDATYEPAPALSSTLQITGELAQRRWLNPVTLPALPCNDVPPPSRVQALVDAAGNVLSAVLLESSGVEPADARALAITRNARFAPSKQLSLGELIFNWRTVPAKTP